VLSFSIFVKGFQQYFTEATPNDGLQFGMVLFIVFVYDTVGESIGNAFQCCTTSFIRLK